jgi:4-carboxymuconolactone decarboxylase
MGKNDKTLSPASEPGAVNIGMRVYKAIPQLGRLRDEVLFGDVWNQPEMSLRDRSLVTCAALAALGRNDELAVHVPRAMANGVTKDEVRGMAVQLAFYAGWPAGIAVGRAALTELES